MPENAILIVAHPDDEILWFSSILRAVGKVIIAFRDYDGVPGLGARRTAAMAELPYANLVCLGIAEAGSLKRADWDDPVPTEFGLALDGGAPDSEIRGRYEQTFATLRAALAVQLRPDMNVFTHNPWGEYGHEDHVQVYRVVDSLRAAIGFRLWTSSYCSSRAAKLASRYRATGQPQWRPIDQAYAKSVAAIYERHECWTWAKNWTWPDRECFLAAPFQATSTGRAGFETDLRFVPSEI